MDPEILAFLASDAGAAAMENPQDDEAGKIAVAIMAKVNKMSSEDMIRVATEEYGQPLTDQTIIELGPGAGYATTFLMAKKPASVLAYEVSPVFRKLLREDTALANAISAGTLVITGDDAISMRGVATSSVDVIFGMNVVYFLTPLADYLKEMLRVLKPGGWIVFGTKMGAAKAGGAAFVNLSPEEIVAEMTAVGFTAAAIAPPRLVSDPPTPATYVPIVCQKPPV
mmetsp:Transcript_8958/g.18076  ORF Transcript_8958/g.18076 Transcript_8958/m.18076 type:complete len:226 (+) Transcript_8958:44-721(+)